jgi:hypothetical protein
MLRRSLSASVTRPNDYKYLVPRLRDHWAHCIDYLRQSIQCSADTTLEEPLDAPSTSPDLAGLDGWGVTHTCRDYSAVYEWAKAHRAGNQAGIDWQSGWQEEL